MNHVHLVNMINKLNIFNIFSIFNRFDKFNRFNRFNRFNTSNTLHIGKNLLYQVTNALLTIANVLHHTVFKKFLLVGMAIFIVAGCMACGMGISQSKAKEGQEAQMTREENSAFLHHSDFPKQAVTFVVPYSAGGTTDIVARKLALLLEPKLGQPIHILNQPGASGAVGTRVALEKPHDGYTYLFTADSLGIQRVMGLSAFSYGDFTPIRLLVNDPKVLVVRPTELEGKSSLEWFQSHQIRSSLPKLSYTGPGGSGHVQALLLEKDVLKSHLIPYPGGREGLLAVMSGQVDFTNANYSSVAGYLQAGQLKAVAVANGNRLKKLPDVPTLGELFPHLKTRFSFPLTPLSLLSAKDVSPEIIVKMRSAVNEVLASNAWQEFVKENELEKLYEKYPMPEDEKTFYNIWESSVSWLLADAGVTVHSPEEFGITRPKHE